MSSGSVLRDLRGVLSWPIGRGVPHPSGCAVLPTQLLILGPHDHHTAGTVSCNQCCIPSAIWALCCLQHSVVPRGQTNLAMWNYHCIPVITQHVYVMTASDQRLEQAKAWDEVMSGTLHTSLCLGLQVPFYFVVDWATIVDIASPALFSLQCCSLEVNGRAHLNIHTHTTLHGVPSPLITRHANVCRAQNVLFTVLTFVVLHVLLRKIHKSSSPAGSTIHCWCLQLKHMSYQTWFSRSSPCT